jgi:hypothetical protein
MATKIMPQKAECINPNSGRSVMIDKTTYDLFSKAFYHTLKKNVALTYTQIVEVLKIISNNKNQSLTVQLAWYAVTVKKEMEVRQLIEVFAEKGKNLHRLKK